MATDDPLNINGAEKPCRICEVLLGFALLLPLIACIALTSEGSPLVPVPWPLLAAVVGLPFAFVGIRILLMSERSRKWGFLPPWLLYASGSLMMLAPTITGGKWAAVGVGAMVIHAARARQRTRAEMTRDARIFH
jgi:hypothetical protein